MDEKDERKALKWNEKKKMDLWNREPSHQIWQSKFFFTSRKLSSSMRAPIFVHIFALKSQEIKYNSLHVLPIIIYEVNYIRLGL